MTFEDTAAKIVKETIRTALSVDDELVEPFSDRKGAHEESCKLYQSFQKEGCALEIARFTSKKRWNSQQKASLLHKDLLILDWELRKTGVKFESALNILSEAVQIPNLPFICIYTKTPDLDEVVGQMYSYLWTRTISLKEKAKAFVVEIEGLIPGFEEGELLNLSKKGIEIICNPDKESQIVKEVGEQIKGLWKAPAIGAFTAMGEKHFGSKRLAEILLIFELSKDQYFKSPVARKRFSISPVESSDKYCFLINNALVQIFHKPGATQTGAEIVTPNKLFEKLSKAVYRRPRNFVSLLGLEFRNYFRDRAKNLGKDLNGINETAFFFHESCVKDSPNGENEFAFFLKDIWNSEVSGDWHKHSPSVLACIEEYKTNNSMAEKLQKVDANKGSSILEDLAQLNATYSLLDGEAASRNAIRFGDIFKTVNPDLPYLLCVTSHCDCLRPKKIRNCFLFVAGKSNTTAQALKKGDRGFLSFLVEDGKNSCVEWDEVPFTLTIKSESLNLAKPISAHHGETKLKLEFLCTQKENYTQRIANQAFSYANRVGISFANLSKFF